MRFEVIAAFIVGALLPVLDQPDLHPQADTRELPEPAVATVAVFQRR